MPTDLGSEIDPARPRSEGATIRRLRKAWRGVERLSAWLLVPLLALQFLSGYAMLHWRLFSGIVDRASAFRIHGVIQPFTVAAFAVHGGSAVRRALRRRGMQGRFVDLCLAAIGGGMVAFAVHLHLVG